MITDKNVKCHYRRPVSYQCKFVISILLINTPNYLAMICSKENDEICQGVMEKKFGRQFPVLKEIMDPSSIFMTPNFKLFVVA